jgi:hypothetical protein
MPYNKFFPYSAYPAKQCRAALCERSARPSNSPQIQKKGQEKMIYKYENFVQKIIRNYGGRLDPQKERTDK